MSKRLEYIDAIKGTMILYMLAMHICNFCLDIKGNIMSEFFEISAMPIFFLVSGYLQKDKSINHRGVLFHSIIDKTKRLLIPTLTCICIYIFFHSSYKGDVVLSFTDVFFDLWWKGFWFTPTLFMVYLFYCIEQHLVPSKHRTKMYILAIVLPCFINHFAWRYLTPETNAFCIRKTLENIPYFYAGLLVKSKSTTFDKYFTKESTIFSVFVVTFVHLYLRFTYDIHNVIEVCYVSLLTILLVFYMFKQSDSFWKRNDWVSKALQYIGRNSLGVYLLHFFFLPCGMLYLTPYVENKLLLIVVTSSVLSVLLAAFVLLVIEIISKSKILSFFLLGDKL